MKYVGLVIDKDVISFDDLGRLIEKKDKNFWSDNMTLYGVYKSDLFQEYFIKNSMDRPRIYSEDTH